jgi:hypothetical protein
MKTELAGAALAMLACASGGPSGSEGTGAEQPFESVVSEFNSGIAEKRREVVRDQESWARLWAEIHRGQDPAGQPPAVDFSRSMLIVAALGTRPTGGFAVKVRGVATRGDRLEVVVLESCPAQGAMVATALTQPVEVVRVARLSQTPTFKEQRETSCR